MQTSIRVFALENVSRPLWDSSVHSLFSNVELSCAEAGCSMNGIIKPCDLYRVWAKNLRTAVLFTDGGGSEARVCESWSNGTKYRVDIS
jgi:hypothetical protein